MEEQKIVSKEVKMKSVVNSQSTKNTDAEGTSLIEELQTWSKNKLIEQVLQMNRQLYNQNNYMTRLNNQLAEMQNYLSNKRMEYLFKIIESANQYDRAGAKFSFDSDFVSSCISEIQEVLTIPEQPETNTDSKED